MEWVAISQLIHYEIRLSLLMLPNEATGISKLATDPYLCIVLLASVTVKLLLQPQMRPSEFTAE